MLLKHRRKLLGAIRSMVGDEHLAEDIFQEVSLVAINKCDQIYDVEHFAPWFRGAARLQALMVLRNRNRLPRMLSSEVLELLEPHWLKFDQHLDADLSDALKCCLDRLSPYSRKIVETRYVQGKRGDNLAAALDRSVNTVYVALSRVHDSLRKCMQRQLATEADRG